VVSELIALQNNMVKLIYVIKKKYNKFKSVICQLYIGLKFKLKWKLSDDINTCLEIKIVYGLKI